MVDDKDGPSHSAGATGIVVTMVVFLLGVIGCNTEAALFGNDRWKDLGAPFRSFFMFGMIATGLLVALMYVVGRLSRKGK